MINIKIKSVWQGKVGIRDKYILQAEKTKEDICLQKDSDVMLIPFLHLAEAIVGRSEYPVRDKYSNESHYLCYFDWTPTTLQKKLF